MSKTNDGGTAFPFTPVPQPRNSDGTWIQEWDAGNPGMSLRAWLAGMAMQGIAIKNTGIEMMSAKEVAMISMNLADALIAELERDKP